MHIAIVNKVKNNIPGLSSGMYEKDAYSKHVSVFFVVNGSIKEINVQNKYDAVYDKGNLVELTRTQDNKLVDIFQISPLSKDDFTKNLDSIKRLVTVIVKRINELKNKTFETLTNKEVFELYDLGYVLDSLLVYFNKHGYLIDDDHGNLIYKRVR